VTISNQNIKAAQANIHKLEHSSAITAPITFRLWQSGFSVTHKSLQHTLR